MPVNMKQIWLIIVHTIVSFRTQFQIYANNIVSNSIAPLCQLKVKCIGKNRGGTLRFRLWLLGLFCVVSAVSCAQALPFVLWRADERNRTAAFELTKSMCCHYTTSASTVMCAGCIYFWKENLGVQDCDDIVMQRSVGGDGRVGAPVRCACSVWQCSACCVNDGD